VSFVTQVAGYPDWTVHERNGIWSAYWKGNYRFGSSDAEWVILQIRREDGCLVLDKCAGVVRLIALPNGKED